MSVDKIVQDLSSQNNWEKISDDHTVKLIKKYTTTSGFGSIILEVSTEIHQAIVNNRKVKLGWNNYNVYNYINILRCFKCWGFDHLATNCNREVVCRLCTENHRENECKSNIKKCINCVKVKNKSKDFIHDPDHCATDRNCSVYLKLLERR
ncbi:GSCOCG00012541001-RA-CDS [Cotesia congregata]|nr:GSCOCG00012541001-RA-CDS [Cotesia congregata]